MKNFLILSGGAFRGSFQLGAVEVLLEKGIKFDKVFGVSTGAINGSLIAQGKITELKKFWSDVHRNGQYEIFHPIIGSFENDKIKISLSQLKSRLLKLKILDIFSGRVKKSVLENLGVIDGLFDMSPLKTKLLNTLELDGFISDFHFGLVDFNTGDYHLVQNNSFFNIENLVDGIVSSGSMPIISRPIDSVRTYEKSFQNVLDGGVRKNSPIGDAIKYIGNDEVHFYIVNCTTGHIKLDTSKKSIVDIFTRTLDIMMSQMFLQDLKTFITINELSDGVRFKKIPYTLIDTQGDLLGDSMKTEKIELRYNLGRSITHQKINT